MAFARYQLGSASGVPSLKYVMGNIHAGTPKQIGKIGIKGFSELHFKMTEEIFTKKHYKQSPASDATFPVIMNVLQGFIDNADTVNDPDVVLDILGAIGSHYGNEIREMVNSTPEILQAVKDFDKSLSMSPEIFEKEMPDLHPTDMLPHFFIFADVAKNEQLIFFIHEKDGSWKRFHIAEDAPRYTEGTYNDIAKEIFEDSQWVAFAKSGRLSDENIKELHDTIPAAAFESEEDYSRTLSLFLRTLKQPYINRFVEFTKTEYAKTVS